LFRNMKRDRQAMAVVLDEYGGMSGIITLKDLVEQLVGDLVYDSEEEQEVLIAKLDECTWQVSGSALLEDISEEIGVKLPCEDYDTFNGLVFHKLEGIPEDDEKVEFDMAGLHIQVTKIENHLVESALLVKK